MHKAVEAHRQLTRDGPAFIKKVLDAATAAGIRYAVLHAADDLSVAARSDLDIVLDQRPDHEFATIVSSIGETTGYKLLHCMHYELEFGFYFILRNQENGTFVHLDCLYDPQGLNSYFLSSSDFLENRTQYGSVFTADPTYSALYLLLKRSVKSLRSDNQLLEMQEAVAAHAEFIGKEILRLTGKDMTKRLGRLLEAPDLPSAQKHLGDIRRSFQSNSWHRSTRRFVTRAYLEVKRRLHRLMYPQGLFVVVVGPDGCGKSTVVDRITMQFERGFRKSWRFHWRPGLLPRPIGAESRNPASEVGSAPARQSRYRGWRSWIRLVYYLCDFIIGYWAVVHLRKAKTTLVLGERYFADVVVNPARYGFSQSVSSLKVVSKLVPKPDITILLSNDPAVIHSRKAELDESEIANQLTAFRDELPAWGRYEIVKTSDSPENVAVRIIEICSNLLAERTRNRLPAVAKSR